MSGCVKEIVMLRRCFVNLLVAVTVISMSVVPAMAQELEEVELQGTVFHDLNGTGLWDVDEPLIPAIEITLSNGEQDQVLVTDENGQFAAVVAAGIWTFTLPEESEWAFGEESTFIFEVSGLEDSVSVSLGLVPVEEEPTPTPEVLETETVEDGTPAETEEPLFVEDADDGVDLPLLLPESGISVAPVVGWGIGFGLLIALGAVLIVIGRRGGLK
jgi:hypothetical protein